MALPSRAGLDRLHEAMAARVAKGELPGLVTAVADENDVHVDTIGTLAFDSTEPMRRDTIFRITSMTKPVLGAVTMMLVDDGLLALDEPVDKVLPELADRRVLTRIDGPLDETVPARRPLTVEDLLTFRLGHGLLSEPEFNPPYPVVRAAEELDLVMGPPDPRTPHDPDEWLRRFATLPLMYQPGERWIYNTGALVLGVLVARAAGQPLGDVMRDRLFEPLGMSETGFWLPAEQVHRMPSCYFTNPETGALEETTAQSPPDLWTRPPAFPSGAAGLVSTADDYLAFARFLLRGGVHEGRRLLSAESVARMTTNQLTPEQLATAGFFLRPRGWGLGLSVTVEPEDASPEPGRYGWEGGSGAAWYNDPHRGRICLALSQSYDFLFNGTKDEFLRLALTA
jgi:CubicO group peptidase (beta-lactamase class C family)